LKTHEETARMTQAEDDKRLFAPAAARNRGPILDVLREELPAEGLVLEIASGTGEHAAHFAAHLPGLVFQPTERDERARESAAAWAAASGLGNLRTPLALDVTQTPWPITRADAIVCINMVHISPWESTESLFATAALTLPAGAPLLLYGPYKRGGAHTAPSNEEFDASLRAADPAWGVRDLEIVVACARKNGFSEPRIVEMPANNLTLVFRLLRAR
jgi:cyclopropane fatty-acyl-phospholipid synthase-like methyltransferase